MTWVLKHEDGQYLENVFAPDEHEPVCDFRDVPQRMAIRFGHRQAAKDARQVIHDRLGVRFRIVRLKSRASVTKAALCVALGEAAHFHFAYRKEQRRTRALGDAVSAASSMFDAHATDEAQLVLVAAHRMHIGAMRDAVSNEPGGIAYEARKAGQKGSAER